MRQIQPKLNARLKMTSIASSGQDAMEQGLSVRATKRKIRIFGFAQKKDAVAISQETYESMKSLEAMCTNVFGGSLRVFWGNVSAYGWYSGEMNSYLNFFKAVITQELQRVLKLWGKLYRLWIKSQKIPKSLWSVYKPNLSRFTSAMDQRKNCWFNGNGHFKQRPESLTAAQKKSTDAAKSKAAALEKKVDTSHQEAVKQFKAYNKVQVIITPVGDPSTVADLWMQEVKYCEAATKFVSQCAEYRKTMSEMYMSYQSLILRLGNLRYCCKNMLGHTKEVLQLVNSQELSVLTAALDALDGEKETVMQLKRAQEEEGRQEWWQGKKQ